jgi:hypothetical protein
MARIEIAVEDGEGGAVDIKLNFDPPIETIDPNNQTRAQMLTAEILNFLSSLGAEERKDNEG